MKTLTSAVLALAIITSPLAITSCTQQQITDAAIIAGVTVATTTGLKMAIQDPARRTVIADYLDVYATALRSVTGNPTPAQLTDIINGFIPPNVKEQYPELVTFAIPLIVSAYKQAYDKWGKEKAWIYLNDIATGLEDGAACCITVKLGINLHSIQTDTATVFPQSGLMACNWFCEQVDITPSDKTEAFKIIAANFK